MINARRNFPAVAGEGFGWNEFAAADFVVAVGKSAAGQADGKIRVRPQSMRRSRVRNPDTPARAPAAASGSCAENPAGCGNKKRNRQRRMASIAWL